MSTKALTGSVIIGQSGGPSAVINASAYGVIKTALENETITKVYGAYHGIKGVLNDQLMIMDEEDPKELELLLSTPSSALGSCRYKIADPDVDDTDYVESGRFACKISDSYGAEAESPLLYRLWLSCGTVSDRFCGKPWLDEYLFLGSDHSGMAAGKSCVPETESAFCRRTVKENYEQRSN